MTGAAGNDEHEPLIASSVDNQRVTYNNSPQDANTPSQSPRTSGGEVTLGLSSHRNYGAIGATEKVTYTWADVNAFATESRSRSRRFWHFWKPSASTMFQQRKQLLRSVNGAAYPGELLAIMGSSGAGKTTLLNTLTFRTPSGVVASGTRALNGQPATPEALAAMSAYVQQQDLFIGTLTVREHLIFQALVRMDRHIPYAQRMRRVQEVISELALSKCQNTVIGIPGRLKGISGGEMKRLSFASEVLTDPPLMFCDEPTSGLDSFMAQNVIQVLKGLAQKGKTVICTIHQPSSELYAMFDKLLIMADGRVAFLGSPDQATEFFKELGAACPANYNPADHFIQLLAGVPGREEATRHTIDTVCTAFAKSELGCSIAAEAENVLYNERKMASGWADVAWSSTAALRARRSPYKASWCAQFRAVLWRSWLSVTKEPMLIKVRFLQTIMVSILIGVIYFGQHLDQDGVMNINGAIFMFLTNMTFQNIFAVINVFCSELPIFIREHHSGMYRADVYFLSKTLAEAPVFATIPLVFTTIAYYMIGLNPAPERFFIASGLAALITNVATSFGYLISCASSSVSMAASVGPPIIIPFMLFGGFFLNSGSVPPYLGWISYLSWFRYGNEALLINQWSGVDSIACTRENFTCPASGQVVLDTLSFSEDDFTMDVVNMVLLFIGFRLLAYIALLLRTRRGK
ncbi:protein white isoform X1 [Pectinophora gossypiella]|uniref:protein white isoform X1 n=1 Tax=Pectinophora gossypiella TaxID=13191 RepID=UPI00214E5B93|nr:protein white isoform X1 [Pectinophora gossypiella]